MGLRVLKIWCWWEKKFNDFNFKEASIKTTLPKEPNEEQVEEFLISLYEDYYNK